MANAFRKKKVYGEYRTVHCPFCERLATQKNEQGIEVCFKHTKECVEEIKCTCGSWLEPKSGKFGRYFNCINCGNINYDKAMQVKNMTTKDLPVKKEIARVRREVEKKETTISSRDVEWF